MMWRLAVSVTMLATKAWMRPCNGMLSYWERALSCIGITGRLIARQTLSPSSIVRRAHGNRMAGVTAGYLLGGLAKALGRVVLIVKSRAWLAM